MKLQSKIETLTVKQFTDLKLNKKIKLEPSFQRGTDDVSSWNTENKKDYIHSTLEGTATNFIHLVDVKKALEFNDGGDPESYKYFKKLYKKGYIYLSIDGNNRSISLKDFKNNSFKMYQRQYILGRGTVDVTSNYATYKTMDGRLKELYDTTNINLIIYSNVTFKKCSELFRDVNRGKGLNDQQFRQSYICKTADFVRDMRAKFIKSFKNFISESEIRELKGDEFIAKMISYAFYGESDKSKLDKLYFDSDNGHVEKLRLFSKNNPPFVKVLKNFFQDIQITTNQLSANAIFDYFRLLMDYENDNIKINNHKKFYQLWLENYSNLQTDKETLYSVDGYDSKYTFNETIRKIPITFSTFRQNVIKSVIEPIALDKNYIIQQGHPKDRFFTTTQKYLLWKKQNGKSPVTGKKIPLVEIYDHTKWQADHIDPWDNGGKTTIENGQLIESSINASFRNKIK
jgi:hypothetical protein|tara:strand:- start:91 stop:1461 length:1371 start_codon:yes stop_codon:yes gene_type:complete